LATAASPSPSLGTSRETAGRGASLPAWCPPWAERLGDAYLSGTSCMFLLHGNVRDLVAVTPPGADASTGWGTVPDFLAREMFGGWGRGRPAV
jgi:hypothetical protein